MKRKNCLPFLPVVVFLLETVFVAAYFVFSLLFRLGTDVMVWPRVWPRVWQLSSGFADFLSASMTYAVFEFFAFFCCCCNSLLIFFLLTLVFLSNSASEGIEEDFFRVGIEIRLLFISFVASCSVSVRIKVIGMDHTVT